MAKKVTGYLKLQVPAGAANPSPPIGPALGQRGLNIMEFCKAFNAQTQKEEKNTPIPVVITIYADRSFTFEMKTPPMSYFLKQAAKIQSGSKAPGRDKAGAVTKAQVRDIAEKKMKDLNCDSIESAMKMVEERATSKFDEPVEIAINLGVDPRHADQMVRGVVTLPNGTGRTLRVGVFARGAKAEEAKAAGADVVGAEDLVEKVQGGTIDFDRCIATPDMMPLVGRLGKVLGPRGMMPNPKVGTVTMDVTAAVKASKGGAVEFRAEKAGIVQGSVGKASFDDDKLIANIAAFVDAVIKAKPTGAKGTYMHRAAISSTMGPGVKLDLSTLQTAAQVGA